jgi:hypothetical protein
MHLQLIYASTPFGFDDGMLAGILADARRCNARDGITGALIVRQDLYLQLLEGPPDAVESAFQRISRDDRHVEIEPLVRRQVPDRIFPDWSMRDDPARSWMWTMDDVANGAVRNASEAEVVGVFERLATEAPAASTQA